MCYVANASTRGSSHIPIEEKEWASCGPGAAARRGFHFIGTVASVPGKAGLPFGTSGLSPASSASGSGSLPLPLPLVGRGFAASAKCTINSGQSLRKPQAYDDEQHLVAYMTTMVVISKYSCQAVIRVACETAVRNPVLYVTRRCANLSSSIGENVSGFTRGMLGKNDLCKQKLAGNRVEQRNFFTGRLHLAVLAAHCSFSWLRWLCTEATASGTTCCQERRQDDVVVHVSLAQGLHGLADPAGTCAGRVEQDRPQVA